MDQVDGRLVRPDVMQRPMESLVLADHAGGFPRKECPLQLAFDIDQLRYMFRGCDRSASLGQYRFDRQSDLKKIRDEITRNDPHPRPAVGEQLNQSFRFELVQRFPDRRGTEAIALDEYGNLQPFSLGENPRDDIPADRIPDAVIIRPPKDKLGGSAGAEGSASAFDCNARSGFRTIIQALNGAPAIRNSECTGAA